MPAKTIFATVGLAVVMVGAAVAGAASERVYDASGVYRGRVETSRDGQQRSYDAAGRYVGRATAPGRNGQDRRIYGPDGRYLGRTDGGPSKGQAGQGRQ
jgi:hypothetical protein